MEFEFFQQVKYKGLIGLVIAKQIPFEGDPAYLVSFRIPKGGLEKFQEVFPKAKNTPSYNVMIAANELESLIQS